ncbi:hypothetical protein [uncultured Metabacillus sp.]|uniref:hypothetical protein n=1 Tax=uncultured Metabacillus sp. TaxID=2860135 RepID=UPI00261CDC3B|nr:hypothetical protein [uncultured Metabacillus sp.]
MSINKIDSQFVENKSNGKSVRDEINEVNAQLAQTSKRITQVTYTMFGAPLNGIDDDTPYVVACHEYANANNLSVRQNTGTLYLKTASNIVVKTSLDLTGCTIKIDQNLSNRTIYKVMSDFNEETITITSQLKSELIENITTIPSLSSRKFSIFKITCDDLFANRSGEDAPYTKSESFTILTNGVLVDGGLIFGYTTATNPILKARSIQDKPIQIKGSNITINTTDNTKIPKLFYVSRSNVEISGFNIFIESMPINTDTSGIRIFKDNIFHIDLSYNVTIKDFGGEGITAQEQNSSVTPQTGGVISVNYSSYVNMYRLNMLRGHGCIGSGWVKKITVSDSLLNRIDCHYVHRGFTISNVEIIGNNGGLMVGWGKGTWNVTNLRTQHANTSNIGGASVMSLRNDVGNIFEGTINLDGAEVTVSENISSFNLCSAYLVSDYDYACPLPHNMPRVIMKNVNVYTKHNTTVYGLSLQIGGTYYASHKIKLNEIELSNIRHFKENVSATLTSFYVRVLNDSVSGKATLKFNNSSEGITLESLRLGNYTLTLIDERTTKTELFDVQLNNVEQKINLSGGYATLKGEQSKIYATVANSGTFNSVNLSNCEVEEITSLKDITADGCLFNKLTNSIITAKVKNSTINSSHLTSSGVTTYAEFDNCTITPAVQSSQSQLKLTNAVLRNNIIKSNGANPVYAPTSWFNANCLFLSNIVQGAVVSVADTNNLYKYIGTSYQTPS